LPTKQVRATDGSKVVLVLSNHLHRDGRNRGRLCKCGALWTVQIGPRSIHVWRNGVRTDESILDYTGNNAQWSAATSAHDDPVPVCRGAVSKLPLVASDWGKGWDLKFATQTLRLAESVALTSATKSATPQLGFGAVDSK
jgi:hypothetical protein